MNIKDFGFDKFLRRVLPSDNTPIKTRTTATELSGGVLKSAGDIEIGSKLFTMSGEDSNIIVNDGSKDRILIGKRKDGTYGIDVSSVGYSVHEAYEGEMDLTSAANDDWTEFDPSAFTYLSTTTLTVASKYNTVNDFAIGDKVKLVQGGNTKYFYIYNNQESEILSLRAGSSYSLANETITEIYFSSKANPNGHPIYFSFTSTLALPTGSSATIGSQGTFTGYFMMTGTTVFATYQRIDFNIDTASTIYLSEDLPVARDDTYPIFFVGIGGDSVSDASKYFPIGINCPCLSAGFSDTADVEIYRLDSEGYAWTSSYVNNHQFSIYYKVP